MSALPLVVAGAFSSPYSLKMRAVMRYRHIPQRWVLHNSRGDDLPKPPVPVIPVVAWPDDDGGYRNVMVDSSPQVTRLGAEYSERSLVPPDPALTFVAFLLDYFADQWATKAMYRYRWTYDPDMENAGRLQPMLWWDPTPTAIAIDRSPGSSTGASVSMTWRGGRSTVTRDGRRSTNSRGLLAISWSRQGVPTCTSCWPRPKPLSPAPTRAAHLKKPFAQRTNVLHLCFSPVHRIAFTVRGIE